MDNSNLGIRIKEIRERNKLTQRELANTVGISVPALFNFEKGTKAPSLETLIKLSKALNTTPNDLLQDYIALAVDELHYYRVLIGLLGEFQNHDIKDVVKIMRLLEEPQNNNS